MKLQNNRRGQAAAIAAVLRRPWRLPNIGDALFGAIVAGLGLALLVVAALMVYELAVQSRHAISAFGFGFLTSTTWNPVTREFGAAPAIYGTIFSAMLALLLALPVGVGAAIFLAEIAPPWLRGPLSFLVEMLAAIPSVVFGLWGLYVLVPWVRSPVETQLGQHVSFIPLFNGPPFGVGLLAAGLILAIMILPIITAISRDMILAVPAAQREAMFALGGTKWEVISRGVLPYCRSGLVAAAILALGRALGETMAVTMVIGKNYAITASLFQPASTAASTLASEFNEAADKLYVSALVELGLILMGITLLMNILARLLVWRVARAPNLIQE
jgi:phosphate transport system permease protein